LVQYVTADKLRNPEIMHQIDDFNTRLNTQLDDTNFTLPGGDFDNFYPNNVYKIPMQEGAQNGDLDDRDDEVYNQPEADDIDSYDNLIGATFLLDPLKSPDNVAMRATVIGGRLIT
jgi:hypothetical protein